MNNSETSLRLSEFAPYILGSEGRIHQIRRNLHMLLLEQAKKAEYAFPSGSYKMDLITLELLRARRALLWAD